uniref:Nuclear transport factor 2 family protein n=1 Tax=Caenorhabditis tropicalis TaxID=1561998 RepID=A0A1I7URM5_9PELO
MRLLLLFLLVVTTASSLTIWATPELEIILNQVSLMRKAIKDNNINLLHQLIQFEQDFVSFLKNHKVSDVLLEKEETMPNGEIRGIAKIWAASPHQEPKTSSWIFVLSPSASSPTGLVFTKIMLCDAGCVMI